MSKAHTPEKSLPLGNGPPAEPFVIPPNFAYMPVPAGPFFLGDLVAYALASFPPDPITFQASRLHLALPACPSERPPAGLGWLHEIKFDGYRVIARKHGEQVRI